MCRSGRRHWYDAFDRLLDLDDVEDRQVQAEVLPGVVGEWLLEKVFSPRDSLVGIAEEVLVSSVPKYDHVVLC